MSGATLSEQGRAAVVLAAQGRLVFPCHTVSGTGACSCGDVDCPSVGKHPRTTHGLTDATSDLAQIEAWWHRWPDANIGMRTGAGTVVLDLDGPDAKPRLHDLEAELGCLPATFAVRTRRGWHLYFTLPEHAHVPPSAGKLAPGVDVRGDGGYVIVPPSRHAEGAYYTVENGPARPADLPARWLARLSGADRPPRPAPLALLKPAGDRERAYGLAALDAEAQGVATAAEGSRNDTLNRAAFNVGQLIGAGALDRATAESVLTASALACGLGEREAERTVQAGSTRASATRGRFLNDPPTRCRHVRWLVVVVVRTPVSTTTSREARVQSRSGTGTAAGLWTSPPSWRRHGSLDPGGSTGLLRTGP